MFSAGMLRYGTGGRVRTTNADPLPDTGGTPVNALGRLSINLVDPIAGYSSGLPFDINRRVCMTAAPPVSFSNGIGFAANGRVSIAQTGAIVGYLAAIPRVASGAIAINNNP